MKTPLQRTRALFALLETSHPSHRVYALIDCAQEPGLLGRLERAGAPMACLFDEHEAMHAREAAPHLVELTDPATLAGIIGEGHGRAWCLYMQSTAGFDALMEHLRRYVKCRVRDEDGRGSDAYFAFWDPRVASEWIPSLNPDEARDLFAPVKAFFGEMSGQPDILVRYRYEQGNVHIESLALTHRTVAA